MIVSVRKRMLIYLPQPLLCLIAIGDWFYVRSTGEAWMDLTIVCLLVCGFVATGMRCLEALIHKR